MNSKEKLKIRHNLPYLANNTTNLTVILTHLEANSIITATERQIINNFPSDYAKNCELYRILYNHKNSNVFQELFFALDASGNSHILDTLEKTKNKILDSYDEIDEILSETPKTLQQGDFVKFEEILKKSNEPLLKEIRELQVSQRTNESSKNDEPIWFDVREPIETFTGRSQELLNLHEALQNRQNQLTVLSQMTSISGLGGVGKSELARKYAREYYSSYDGNAIWINAEKNETIRDSFTRLAKDRLGIYIKTKDGQERDIKSIVEDVYKYFSNKKCLIIFDNAEKYKSDHENDEALDKFLPILSPQDNKPFILITSRNKKWPKSQVMPLNTFSDEEAIDFIKKALGLSEAIPEMKLLANKLQNLPLALQQATAYIKATDENFKNVDSNSSFEIKDYLEQYDRNAKALLKFPFFEETGDSYEKTTFITWKITFEAIQREGPYGKIAATILNLLSYCNPDKIPSALFLKLAENKIQILGECIQILKNYSMIIVDQAQIFIHRLVQHVIRIGSKDSKTEIENLHQTLKLITPHVTEMSMTNAPYTSHAISIWDFSTEHSNLVKTNYYFPVYITRSMTFQSRFHDSILFATRTLVILQKFLVENNEGILDLSHEIAYLLYRQAKYQKSIKLYDKLLQIKNKIFGPHHESSLLTLNNIAIVLKAQRKFTEALDIYKRILPIQEKILGRNHQNTLATLNNIGTILSEWEKFDEATPIVNEVYNRRKIIFGPKHPETLTALTNLASNLSAAGNYEKAVSILEKSVKYNLEIFGPTHLETISEKNRLGTFLYRLKRLDEALELYEECLPLIKSNYGQTDFRTLYTKNNIALVLRDKGQLAEAMAIHEEVYKELARQLGPDHTSTLMIQNHIAILLDLQGDSTQAMKIFKNVFEKRNRIFGSTHSDTIRTMYQMGVTMANMGRFMEGMQMLDKVKTAFEIKFGKDHLEVVLVKEKIVEIQEDFGLKK